MSNNTEIEILELDEKLKNAEQKPKAIWITSALLNALKRANRITSRIEGGIMPVDVLDGIIDLNIADNIDRGFTFTPDGLLSV